MVLFGERHAAPNLCDLGEPTRTEVIRLLAELLQSVRMAKSASLPPSQGGRDE
jgi:hypothetical protein